MKTFRVSLYILVSILLIWMPYPYADLILKIYSSESNGNSYRLYYATDLTNNFSGTQYIDGTFDSNQKTISFRIDSSIRQNLSGIRLDIDCNTPLIDITNVTFSSAGVPKKQFSPCTFFSDENVFYTNDISGISNVSARNTTYIAPSGSDPYIIFADNIVSSIQNSFSNYRTTRFFIVLFLWCSYILAKLHIFPKNKSSHL